MNDSLVSSLGRTTAAVGTTTAATGVATSEKHVESLMTTATTTTTIKPCNHYNPKQHRQIGLQQKYRMVALDLDGTLLQSNHQMADIQAEYLRSLHRRGFIVCFATGRAASSVYEHVQKLGLRDPIPVVCSNGAKGCLMTTRDTSASASASASATGAAVTATGPNGESSASTNGIQVENLFYLGVPTDVVRATVQLANTMGYCVQYYVDNHGIFANPRTDSHQQLLRDYTAVVGTPVQTIDDDFESLLQSNDSLKSSPSKLLVRFESGQVDVAYKAFCELLHGSGSSSNTSQTKRATIIRAYGNTLGYFLEILHPDVNKGNGLKRLTGILSERNVTNRPWSSVSSSTPLDLSQVIAMGDGTNDVEFLTLSGLGMAMKNAHPEVLELMKSIQQKDKTDKSNGVEVTANKTLSGVSRITSWTNDEHGVMKTLMSLDEQGLLELGSK